jgi:hypothetical protein
MPCARSAAYIQRTEIPPEHGDGHEATVLPHPRYGEAYTRGSAPSPAMTCMDHGSNDSQSYCMCVLEDSCLCAGSGVLALEHGLMQDIEARCSSVFSMAPYMRDSPAVHPPSAGGAPASQTLAGTKRPPEAFQGSPSKRR